MSIHFAGVIDEATELIDLNRLDRDDARRLILYRLDAEACPMRWRNSSCAVRKGIPSSSRRSSRRCWTRRSLRCGSRKAELLTDNIEAGVPGTIQGIIMARIDRLHDTIKEVLFGASVIGREFSRPLLEHVIGMQTAMWCPVCMNCGRWS